jgi:hypothetical protein
MLNHTAPSLKTEKAVQGFLRAKAAEARAVRTLDNYGANVAAALPRQDDCCMAE